MILVPDNLAVKGRKDDTPSFNYLINIRADEGESEIPCLLVLKLLKP